MRNFQDRSSSDGSESGDSDDAYSEDDSGDLDTDSSDSSREETEEDSADEECEHACPRCKYVDLWEGCSSSGQEEALDGAEVDGVQEWLNAGDVDEDEDWEPMLKAALDGAEVQGRLTRSGDQKMKEAVSSAKAAKVAEETKARLVSLVHAFNMLHAFQRRMHLTCCMHFFIQHVACSFSTTIHLTC